MRRLRRVLLVVVGLLLVALVAGYWWQRPLLLTGTGYAAHNACALDAIAGRGSPGNDLPPNPLVPLLRTSTGDGVARSSILGLLSTQQAFATDGFGCTLADARPDLPEPTPVTSAGNPFTGAAAPDQVPTGVRRALDQAFGADLPAADREELGTRAVVVIKDGRLVAERYAEGFDAETPQLGWSMTKSVANLLVGRLVQEGRISLDDDNLRPEWTDARADITVRDLMQMTSGLRWDETYALNTPITRMLYLEQDMAGYAASQPLARDPSTYLQYSSGSTNLLCSVLVDRTGLGANLPRDLLFAPLGLASAVMEPDAAGNPVCSSYMWATPRDWAAVGQFALDDGVWNGERLLPKGWMAESTQAVGVQSFEPDPYASGWWPNRAPDGTLVESRLPADAYFAEGFDGQWMVVVPSERLVMVRLGFTPTREDDRVLASASGMVEALR